MRKIISIYRESKTIDWKKSKENIVKGLHNQIKRELLSDKKISGESLKPWKFAVLIKVEKNFKV